MCAQSLYVGTYTQKLGHVDGRGPGICYLQYEPADGSLALQDVTPEVRNPSYLSWAPLKGRLYSTEECDVAEDPQIVAYAIQPDGRLMRLNSQTAAGSSPCHILVDPAERWLFVAHYMGGNVAVYPILEDGRLGEVATVVEHSGSGPNAARQDGPHPHSCTLDRQGDYLFVPDLGIDRIVVYAFDHADGELTPLAPAEAARGAGPRHMVVHPNNRFVYVLNELNSTVTCYAHDQGVLTAQETLSTLPAGFTGESLAAAIRLTRDGRFLYVSNRIEGSNRGENCLTGFAVDGERGVLSPIGHFSSGGSIPRDFILDRTDDYLIVANQDSDNLFILRVDAIDGSLSPAGSSLEVRSPASLLLAV